MKLPKRTIPLINYVQSLSSWRTRCVALFFYAWFSILRLVIWILGNLCRPKAVPRPDNGLLMHSATSLAAMIRLRKVTSEAVVEAYVKRIQEVNPYINALVRDRFQKALQEARAVDASIETNTAAPENQQPLLGVPFTVKDAVFFEGMIITAGLDTRKEAVATFTALALEKMTAAGAILIAITNVSECCLWWECYNVISGLTKNPHDLRRTSGGSSGGEGALLGAAASLVGIGTDIGGSIRIPAAFCGVFGHKPSANLVPNNGCYPPLVGYQNTMHCVGPMCRYAEDLATVLNVLVDEPYKSQLRLFDSVNLRDVKIYYIDHLSAPYLYPVQSDVKRAMYRTLSHFQIKYNQQCMLVDFPLMTMLWTLWYNDMAVPDSSFKMILTECKKDLNVLAEFGRILVGIGRYTVASLGTVLMQEAHRAFGLIRNPKEVQNLRDELKEQLNRLLGDNGVLILPAHPTTAPFDHSPILMPFNFLYTAIFNSLGLPATVCPVGLGENGMPLSVQVVAAERQDRLTLAIARDIQFAFGGSAVPQ